MSGRYEGDGYTIVDNGGGECISYSYYCGDKKVYSTFVLVSFKGIENPFKENKKLLFVEYL